MGAVVSSVSSSGGAGLPAGAIAVNATATGTTAAVTATLPGTAGKTTYLAGIAVSPGSATTAIVGSITTTGLTNNLNISDATPATAAGVTGANVIIQFNPPIPASAANTAINVTQSAAGAGGAGVAVNAWGYQV